MLTQKLGATRLLMQRTKVIELVFENKTRQQEKVDEISVRIYT